MVERISVPAPTLSDRATRHRALGDETRLRLVDALQVSDRSPRELAELTGVPSNLLAFHLGVLEEANLVRRTASRGDARRRYVTLVRDRLEGLDPPPPLPSPAEQVLFVCTANAARSQLAASLWHARTGLPALSAGTHPAAEVHPRTVEVADERGLELSTSPPTSYRDLDAHPDLVVSVCDRAHEARPAFDAPLLHWSVDDPVGGGPDAFHRVFEELSDRIERLARALPRSTTPPCPTPRTEVLP
jgi:ArsR family transcriptional regulator, arsenate/arsenite/antimonite-responsive transcriptional repressor / arsenate reductase (thioredoxin)